MLSTLSLLSLRTFDILEANSPTTLIQSSFTISDIVPALISFSQVYIISNVFSNCPTGLSSCFSTKSFAVNIHSGAAAIKNTKDMDRDRTNAGFITNRQLFEFCYILQCLHTYVNTYPQKASRSFLPPYI